MCNFVLSLMAFVCQEIKGLLTYLLTYLYAYSYALIGVCSCVEVAFVCSKLRRVMTFLDAVFKCFTY